MYRPNLKSVPDIICSFGVGLRTSNLGEEEAVEGLGVVPFEKALMNSYRPSIVTFPLSLRVSEILPLLCSSTPLFPIGLPPLFSPKFPHVPLGLRGWPLSYEEQRCCLIVSAISFQDFQPM